MASGEGLTRGLTPQVWVYHCHFREISQASVDLPPEAPMLQGLVVQGFGNNAKSTTVRSAHATWKVLGCRTRILDKTFTYVLTLAS